MIVRCKGIDLAPESLGNVGEQSVATCNHNVFEKVSSDAFVALHDGVVDVLLDTFLSDVRSLGKLRLEKNLGAAETLFAEDDFATIWQLESFLASLGL